MILNLNITIECKELECFNCKFQFLQNCILFSEELEIIDGKKTKCKTCIEHSKGNIDEKTNKLKCIPSWDNDF